MCEERRWLFFDIGSTLVDESKAYDAHRDMMLFESGITREEFNEKRMEFYRKGKDGNSGAKEYFSLPDKSWPSEEEKVYPDAYETLLYLKERGFSLGIIANQPKGTLHRLEEYGLRDFFSVIESSFECGLSKPDERIYKEALRKAGITSEKAYMIGDRLDNDMLPSHMLGFKTIWIRSGMWKNVEEEYLPSYVDYTINTLSELKVIFS